MHRALYFSHGEVCHNWTRFSVASKRPEGDVSALAEGLFAIRMRDTSTITFMYVTWSPCLVPEQTSFQVVPETRCKSR